LNISQDKQPGVLNRTLIIDNYNRRPPTAEVDYSKWKFDGGRTWLHSNESEIEFEEVHILRRGELAIYPDVKR
jgi:hypothetical protein